MPGIDPQQALEVVQGLIFLAQGTRLASVSADATVRIWDLTDPAKK